MTLNMEVKKHAMQQLQDGSWKLTVTIHPSDMPMELLQAPMGTPYGLAMIPIDYDNPDVSKMESTQKEKSEGEKLRERACILCQEEEFQSWIIELDTPGFHNYSGMVLDFCKNAVYKHCNIKSRSELATNKEAQTKFRQILDRFNQWKSQNRYGDDLDKYGEEANAEI